MKTLATVFLTLVYLMAGGLILGGMRGREQIGFLECMFWPAEAAFWLVMCCVVIGGMIHDWIVQKFNRRK